MQWRQSQDSVYVSRYIWMSLDLEPSVCRLEVLYQWLDKVAVAQALCCWCTLTGKVKSVGEIKSDATNSKLWSSNDLYCFLSHSHKFLKDSRKLFSSGIKFQLAYSSLNLVLVGKVLVSEVAVLFTSLFQKNCLSTALNDWSRLHWKNIFTVST